MGHPAHRAPRRGPKRHIGPTPAAAQVQTWLRPPLTFAMRRILWVVSLHTTRLSSSPAVHFYNPLVHQLAIQFLLVRLVTTCGAWHEFALTVALDWASFAARSAGYWRRMRTGAAPAPPGPRGAASALFAALFPLAHLPFAGADPSYFTFIYVVENLALSATYVAALAGYGWHRLAQMRGDDAVHRFWFPHGAGSVRFLCIAAALDLVQDLLAHALARGVAARHGGSGTLSRLFPGWLRRPRAGVLPAMLSAGAVWFVPLWLTQCAWAFSLVGAAA